MQAEANTSGGSFFSFAAADKWLEAVAAEAAQGFIEFFEVEITEESRDAAEGFAPIETPLSDSESILQASPKASPVTTPTSKPRQSPAPSVAPKASTIPKTTLTEQKKETCQRFLVSHLDGSSSNRCYSQSDYSQLRSLAQQASAAQTFYQFHLDGVARYQALYEESGSSIWLDAKASSQAKADQEKEKIGALHLQMYTIETRGSE